MRGHDSVLHAVLKLVRWDVFDRLVEEHGSDALVRRFKTRHQLIALIYGQLSGSRSLREIETRLSSHEGVVRVMGGRVPKRSTFSDANRQRSPLVFSGLFEHMLAMAGRGVARRMGDAVRLIDSSGLRLAGAGSDWAKYSAKVCGAKVHIIYDPDQGRPIYHAISPARVNDITAAKAMPIEAGATYVFDLGYYDYAWWATLDEAGCRLVTRFKSNTRLSLARACALRPGGGVLSDRIGFLPGRQARSRRNPMSQAVREIVVRTETGKRLRLLTNDLDAPAGEIADLYKRRWQIELFFRLMKQTLMTTHFIGRSENAVRIQIAVALLTCLLLRLLQSMTKVKHGWLELVRLVQANLMHRRDFRRLLESQPPPRIDNRQMAIDWG